MLYKALLCGVIFIKNHIKIKMFIKRRPRWFKVRL